MPKRILVHSIRYKVISTVCNMNNMLKKLSAFNGDVVVELKKGRISRDVVSKLLEYAA